MTNFMKNNHKKTPDTYQYKLQLNIKIIVQLKHSNIYHVKHQNLIYMKTELLKVFKESKITIFVICKRNSIEMKVEVIYWTLFLLLVNYVSFIKTKQNCIQIQFLSYYQSISIEYEVELEKMVSLPGPNVLTFDTFRVKKYNRSTYVLNGNFSLSERLDDTADLRFVSYNFQGREYRKVFERFIPKLCSSLFRETFRKSYGVIVAHSNFPKFGDCDFRPVSICNLRFIDYLNILFDDRKFTPRIIYFLKGITCCLHTWYCIFFL